MIDRKYVENVYEKIGKANLNNTLKIADEIKQTDDSFNKFVDFLMDICNDTMLQNKDKNIRVIAITHKYMEMYESDMKYNLSMVADNFIMELCNAMRGF